MFSQEMYDLGAQPSVIREIFEYGKARKAAIGAYGRFEFYEQARQCYCILQSGETAIYANVILQKGVVKG